MGRPQASPRTFKAMLQREIVGGFLDQVTAPTVLDNTHGILEWGMMANDRLGDCTCAALGHMVQAWTAETGAEVTVPDSAILTAYEQACGYNPADPSSDQGGIIATVLDYFRDVGVDGHRIAAHAPVNLTQMRVQQAMYIFDTLDIGVALPITAQGQVGGTWQIVDFAQAPDAQPGSWGGHSVPIVGYDLEGLTCVTWGELQRMTWQFFMYYTEEAHACISPDDKVYPVDVEQLIGALADVGT